MRIKTLRAGWGDTCTVPSTAHALSRPPRAAWLLAAALLAGCNEAPPTPSAAESQFDALVAACTQTVAGRRAVVRPEGAGGWSKTGYSAALVQGEVKRTETPATPYVGKIVVKDNHARATADTQAAADAVVLAPAHLLANRTHTFIYSHDGQRWQWQNGMRMDKTPSQPDASTPLTLADVQTAEDNGFAGCVPR